MKKLILFGFFAVALVAVVEIEQAMAELSGEVDAVEYEFDFTKVENGSVSDSAGTYRAELVGSAQISSDGERGNVLSLDGARGCMRLDPQVGRWEQGTLDMWIYPFELKGVIVGKYGSISLNFGGLGPAGVLCFGLKDREEKWHVVSVENLAVPLKKWSRVTATWGAAGMTLAFNGELIATKAFTGRGDYSDKYPIVIGSYTSAGADESLFHGKIAKLRISNSQEVEEYSHNRRRF